jgi:FkbM family methyltransferase
MQVFYEQLPLDIRHIGGFDVAYRAGTRDETIIERHSFDRDIFLSAIPDYSLPTDATVLDVGAHIGTFSLLAGRKAPRGRVFAVEASRNSFNFLRINIALNGLGNIHADHLAIAGRPGVATLYHDPTGNWGNSITSKLSSCKESVEATSLVDYMRNRMISRVDLAKFNCEGAEFEIILGTPTDVLGNFKTMIVLYHCDLVDRRDESDLTSYLTKAGFSLEFKYRERDRGWIIASRND